MIHKLQIKLKKDADTGFTRYMGSMMQGVIMEQISNEYAEKMHISQMHPYSQYISVENGAPVWNIIALNDEAMKNIIDPLMSSSFMEAKIKKHNLTMAVEKKEYSVISYGELFDRNYLMKNSFRYVEIEFITPASFKNNGRYIIFPEAPMILKNLIRKYDLSSCETELYDELLIEEIERNTDIVDYSMRTVRFCIEGIKIPSFIGRLTLKFSGAPQFIRLMNMLTEFGEYSGTGIKTSMGMGAYKITDKRGKC